MQRFINLTRGERRCNLLSSHKKKQPIKYEAFIASKFLNHTRRHSQNGQPQKRGNDSSLSAPLVVAAIVSITLGVLVMIMSVSILRGFQNEITRKVTGFDGDIIITSFSSCPTYQDKSVEPISNQRDDIQRILNTPGVRHVQYYAILPGMVKTDNQIHGIAFKGISTNYDTTFISSCLKKGRTPQRAENKTGYASSDSIPANYSNEVIISQTLANKLYLDTGDKLRTYFLQGESYRARAFTVCGIYQSDFADFDEHFIIGDIAQVQRLRKWNASEVEGYEVLLDNTQTASLNSTINNINNITNDLSYNMRYDLSITTIVEQNQSLFAWLQLLNSNIILILSIMALVCIVAIVSALLIIIFEKTSTIGLLKALGATNRSIRKIFLNKSAQIISIGIALGDAIAFILCLLQYKFHIIHLDSESYYMDFVPISLNACTFVIISLSTLAVCLITLLIPATYISKILPSKSIKFN